MKKSNLKKLNNLIGKLEEIKAAVETIRDDEQESFDSKSDNWRDGEKGEEAQEQLNTLEEIVTGLESAFDGMNAFNE